MTLIGIAALLTLAPSALKPTQFEPPPLSQFDGKSWGGIVLGVTTDGDLKKTHQRHKDAIRPEALRMTDGKSEIRVDALLDGRGGKAKVISFVVQFSKPIPVDKLHQELGKPEVYYQRGRKEDWKVAKYPSGAVAVVEPGRLVQMVFLVAPERSSLLVAPFSPLEEPIVSNVDPHAGKPKIATFGEVKVTYDIGRIGFKDRDKDEREWKSTLRGIRAGGKARYEPGAPGIATAHIRTQYDSKRGGTVTITISFLGQTAYGNVRVSAQQSGDLPTVKDEASAATFELNSSLNYTIASVNAMRDLDREIKFGVDMAGPPPIHLLRRQAVEELLKAAGAVAPGEKS